MPRNHRKSTSTDNALQTSAKAGVENRDIKSGQALNSSIRVGNPNGKQAISSLETKSPWTPWARFAVSILLIYHILAMFVSPWAVPPTSRFVVGLEYYFANYQTALYLNHGYRFFAPDPGPASVVSYQLIMPDGSRRSGLFPDRNVINRQYPRLMYHRWFMLSETIGRIFGDEITQQQFQQFVIEEEADIDRLRKQNQPEEADRAATMLADEKKVWAGLLVERQKILQPIAKSLLTMHKASEIKLSLNRRLIPSLTEARLGMKTSDQRLMEPTNAIELGVWKVDSSSGQVVAGLPSTFGISNLETMPSRLEN